MEFRSSYEIRLRRRKIAWLCIIGVIIVAIIFLFYKIRKNSEDNSNEPVIVDNGNYVYATISAVGDITIDDDLMADAEQDDGSYDFLPFFYEAAPYLYEADLTVGNLELNFAGKPYGSTYSSAPEELAQTLQLLGFDILQTANSKSITSGISGMESTISTLKRYGITPLGTYTSKSDKENNQVVVREVNGIRIAFIAFTKGFDGMTLPAGKEYAANVLYSDYDDMYEKVDTSAIQEVVAAAKDQDPDIIIAMVHWGSSYRLQIADTQQTIRKTLLNAGVDVILGTHSHVVGEMDVTTSENGEEITSLVAYSLGNFLSSDTAAYTRDALILNFTITKNVDTGNTAISSLEYVPLYIYDNGETAVNRYCVKDLYLALNKYSSNYYLRLSDNGYTRLTTALEDLQTNLSDPVGETYLMPNPYKDDNDE